MPSPIAELAALRRETDGRAWQILPKPLGVRPFGSWSAFALPRRGLDPTIGQVRLAHGAQSPSVLRSAILGRALAMLAAAACLGGCAGSNAEAGASDRADPAALVAEGEPLYAQHCAVCHMAGGGGVPYLAPSLHDNGIVTGPMERLIPAILYGTGGIDVEREEEFGNVMGAFTFLSDREIAAIASYIRNRFGDGASAVEPGTVAQYRRE